jgi:hypothetical protein
MTTVTVPMASDAANAFPPCTSENGMVDEEEKQRVAASGNKCAMTEKCVQSCSAYGRICPCAARIAAHAACESMKELMENSQIFKPEQEDNKEDAAEDPEQQFDFPFMEAEDIQIGKKLGEGGFSNVNSCTLTKGEKAGQEFAFKYLKKKAMVELHQFKHGAADLAIEAL